MAELPDDQITLWQDQFEALGTDSAEYEALRVLKHVSELFLPPFRRLVVAIGRKVLNIDGFDGALKQLERRKFVSRFNPHNTDVTLVHLHDVRVEAVELGGGQKLDSNRSKIPDFFLNDIDPNFNLPPDFDRLERIYVAVGIAFADTFDDRYNDHAKQHFKTAIKDNDGTFADARYNYAVLLEEELDDPETAQPQSEQAIEEKESPYPEAQFNLEATDKSRTIGRGP